MKNKLKSFWNKVSIQSMILTIILFMTICYLKGIYPFGSNTINSHDMMQSYVTFYYFLHDVLHGSKSILYNFQLGMGSNIYGGFVIDGCFNPTSWLIGLSSRSNILYNMTFIVLVKLIFINITTSCFINKVFPKLNNRIKVMGILMYTFSGYIFFNYSNIMWIDIVGLFPLLCLGIYQILKQQKMSLFTLTLAFILINNYNLAYMCLFFLFFAVPFSVHYLAVNKRKATTQLILGTIISIGLSAFAFIPAFYQTMTSYRMSGAISNTGENIYFFYKLANVLIYSIPIIYFFLLRKTLKKDKNTKVLYASIITTFFIPLIFEKVNLLWHTGSYQCFPFRYGFIISFLLMIVFFYGYQKYKFSFLVKEFKEIKLWLPLILLGFVTFFFWYDFSTSVEIFAEFCSWSQLFLLQFIFLLNLWLTIGIVSKRKNISQNLFYLEIVMIIIYGVAFFGHGDESRFSNEYADRSLKRAVYFSEKLNISNEDRIKDTTISMTENYPLVVDISSNSTFLQLINTEQVLTYKKIGYSSHKTKLNDYGGTLLSDTIYGTKYIITKEKIKNPIYQFYKKVEDFYIYKNPYATLISPVRTLEETKYDSHVFTNQNQLFGSIMDNYNLLQKKYGVCNQEAHSIRCQFSLKDEQLYFYAEGILDQIKINGIPVDIPYISNDQNQMYVNGSNHYVTGILDLGYYEDNEIEVEISSEYLIQDQVYFATINRKDFQQTVENRGEISYQYQGNKMIIDYENTSQVTNLFVPINYDDGFTYLKNGKKTKIKKVFENFMLLSVDDGENHLVLEFYPKLLKESITASIASLLVLIIVTIREKLRKSSDSEWKFLTYPVYFLGILLIIGVSIKIYILPIFQTFLDVFL